jgi:diguanylate cyclase (GGDEF)-like protein
MRIKSAIAWATAYLALHGIGVLAFPRSALMTTYIFMFVTNALAVVACWAWVSRASAPLRLPGSLVGLGLVLWAGGMFLDGYEDLVKHATSTGALPPDLLYFFYGVPVLFATSLSIAEQRSRLFLWLYGLQAAATAYLAYVALFNNMPFSGQAPSPISSDRLADAFLAENVVLAVAAAVRLFSCTTTDERRFYRIVALFLWVYLGCSTVYNYAVADASSAVPTAGDLLIDVPFLMLALLFMFTPCDRIATEPDEPARMGHVALFVASASPIFFTFGMLSLGTVVMQKHFAIGFIGVGIALGCYGLQATLLQNRYIRTQHSLREALDRLQGLSMTDGLTGVANRRCFDQTLEREWSRAKRSSRPLSLLMIDLDFFKNLNDRYGHVYGDECLVTVAHTLRAALPRDADILARYGGEEFAAILPDTDRYGASTVASKMRAAVRRLAIANKTLMSEIVTVSIGISTYESIGDATHIDLIRGSDQALYRAKQQGRDRVEFFDEALVGP